MEIPLTIITKPIITKIIALQSFFFARPRIDIDLINNPENLYGQKSLGISNQQDHKEPIPIAFAVYDLEFHWNYKLRIKNNSSKTAYNIKIEEIEKTSNDYLQKIDEIASLKEGEVIELDYILRHQCSKNGAEANQFLTHFPGHLKQLEILVSYTNESRKVYFTKFIATQNSKTNEHLIRYKIKKPNR
jgi:hypothetical protein